jgi:hypothetical protein
MKAKNCSLRNQPERLGTVTENFAFNEETMTRDVIHKVGPSGEFLTGKRTLKHF